MIFKRKAAHLRLGIKGERLAQKEVLRSGLEILHKNYSVRDLGEVDLIARDGACLVFIEVKTRRGKQYGRAGEAVDAEKRQKIWRAARHYLKRIDGNHLRYRFDVVEVYIKNFWSREVNYVVNAYDHDSF